MITTNEASFKIQQLLTRTLGYPYRHCCSYFPQSIRDAWNHLLGENMPRDIHVEEYDNGFYLGEFSPTGAREGYGAYYWNNDHLYIGEWNNNRRNGTGISVYSNGDIHIGHYANGVRSGKGSYYAYEEEIEIEAIYSNDEIGSVIKASSSFTLDGYTYDKDKKTFTSDSSGCWSTIIVFIIILIALKCCSGCV